MPPTKYLSPPEIDSPVYECSEVVLVTGFTAGATVLVFANGNERIGTATPYIGWWHVPLERPLTTADVLTAVQVIGNDESFPTRVSVPVLPHNFDPEDESSLAPPKVEGPLLHCQQSVIVSGTFRGAHVDVYDANDQTVPRPPLGVAETPVTTAHVVTFAKLVDGMQVFAEQTVCRHIHSQPSAPPLRVDRLPSSLPAPQPREPILGSTVIVMDGLVTGAEVDIFAGNNRVGGGIATSPSVIFQIPPVQPVKYRAEQALCELRSPSSKDVDPVSTLGRPVIEEPICPDSTAVRVTNTVLGATVKIFVNGKQRGQISAVGLISVIVLGDQVTFREGDSVIVTQETTMITPVASDPPVPVNGQGGMARPKVLGGHPFFAPRPGEQAIPGPVYLRGSANAWGPGPTVYGIFCGALTVEVSIRPPGDPAERPPFKLTMTEQPEGHFVGSWDWSQLSRASIAVGEYRAVVRVVWPQQTIDEEIPFFVIFDPAEVTAPARFSLDGTGIWFGTGWGKIIAQSYQLHLQDNRIFGWAISVVNGETSAFSAAQLLVSAEHNRFGYDLGWHADDTLDMLEHETHAQCADDANMLTALLRSVGIPAHPTTIDARLEFSDATWTFDTWVEARLAAPQGERWYSMHSHHHNIARGPVTRRDAGQNWGEASRLTNDMVVMATETWVAAEVGDTTAEVSYDWNTPCKRPRASVLASAWIENLTDNRPDTYWAKPYWQCSPDYEATVEIEVPEIKLRPGDAAEITVILTNRSDSERTAQLSVLLCESRPDSKAFAERIELLTERNVSVPLSGRVRLPVGFTLPATVCTDNNIFLAASFGDDRAIAFLQVIPTLDLDIQVEREVTVGNQVFLRVEASNATERPVEEVTLTVRTPFGMSIGAVEERGDQRTARVILGTLPAGKSGAADFVLVPEAVLEAGILRVEVTSSGGYRRLTIPIVVRRRDPEPPTDMPIPTPTLG